MEPLDVEGLGWAGRLARWTELAQASLAWPADAGGDRWRDAVPAVIELQAVTHALGELAALPREERPLARDRARRLVSRSTAEIDRLWRGAPMPVPVREIRDDARAALEEALYAGAVELVWLPPPADPARLLVVPTIDPGDPEGTLAVMQPGTLALPGEPVAWWADREGGAVSEALAACRRTSPRLPRQVYRQIDEDGAIVRDVVRPITAEPAAGLPLLVPLCAEGHPIGRFTVEAVAWEAQQRSAWPEPGVPVDGLGEPPESGNAEDGSGAGASSRGPRFPE